MRWLAASVLLSCASVPSDHPYLVQERVSALRAEDSATFSALEQAMRHPDERIRALSVKRIGELGLKSLAPEVWKAAETDASPLVQIHAIRSYVTLLGPTSAPALATVASSRWTGPNGPALREFAAQELCALDAAEAVIVGVGQQVAENMSATCAAPSFAAIRVRLEERQRAAAEADQKKREEEGGEHVRRAWALVKDDKPDEAGAEVQLAVGFGVAADKALEDAILSTPTAQRREAERKKAQEAQDKLAQAEERKRQREEAAQKEKEDGWRRGRNFRIDEGDRVRVSAPTAVDAEAAFVEGTKRVFQRIAEQGHKVHVEVKERKFTPDRRALKIGFRVEVVDRFGDTVTSVPANPFMVAIQEFEQRSGKWESVTVGGGESE